MSRFVFVVSFVLCGACGVIPTVIGQFKCENAYVNPAGETSNITNYQMNSQDTRVTAKGVHVDVSGQNVDLNRIDLLVDETETCLRQHGVQEIKRCGVTVKVAPDWFYQECAGSQTFPCRDPGFKPGCEKLACRCGCYGAIQYPGIVVVAPDLKAFKHELIHDVTFSQHADQEKDLAMMPDVFACQ